MVHQEQLEFRMPGRGSRDITGEIGAVVTEAGCRAGLCNMFIHHTSASLLLTENADSQVRLDLETFLAGLVPDGDPMFRHDAEGPDDMPAHVRTVLTETSLTIPVRDGRLALGTWQGVFLWEHRQGANTRRVTVTVLGE